MWLLFSILTVIFWGTSETIFKKSSKGDEHSVVHLLAYNGIFFGISGIIYMLIVYKGFDFDFMNMLRYLPIAAVYILSMFSYYQAMKRVKISLISPIVNSSCVITVLLCIFVLGQYPTPVQLVAIVLIIGSIIMLSLNKNNDEDVEKDLKPSKTKLSIFIIGIICALGYFVLDGLASFLDEFTLEGAMREEDMLISYALIYLVVGIGCYIYLKVKDKNYRIHMDKLKFAGSIVETAGQYMYIYALGSGDASIISPFVASYSVVTIILSRMFLKEKLRAYQYIWIALIMIGVVILSLE